MCKYNAIQRKLKAIIKDPTASIIIIFSYSSSTLSSSVKAFSSVWEFKDGIEVGMRLGNALGVKLGIVLGIKVGILDGNLVGIDVGNCVGYVVGNLEGTWEGIFVGKNVLQNLLGVRGHQFILPEILWLKRFFGKN